MITLPKRSVAIIATALAIASITSCQLGAMKRAGDNLNDQGDPKKLCLYRNNLFAEVRINHPQDIIKTIQQLHERGLSPEAIVEELNAFLQQKRISLLEIKSSANHTVLHLACAQGNLMCLAIILNVSAHYVQALILAQDLISRTAFDMTQNVDILNLLFNKVNHVLWAW